MAGIVSVYLKEIERRNRDEHAFFTLIVEPYQTNTVKEIFAEAMNRLEEKDGMWMNEFTLKGYLSQVLTDVNIPHRILPQRMLSGDNHVWQLALATGSRYFYQDTECRSVEKRFLMYETKTSNGLAATGTAAATEYQKELMDVLADLREAVYVTPELEDNLPDYKVAFQEEIKAHKQSYEDEKAGFYIGRFRFCDYYGRAKGIANTDDLQEALKLAEEYQCEIIDKQATGSPILYSVWDGWNVDSDHYEELIQGLDGKER